MSLYEKIENADSIKKMNELRVEVVEAKDIQILKKWQEKYWSFKKCPTCGNIK